MKRFVALVFLAEIVNAYARQPTGDESWTFRRIQEETGLPIESYEYLATAPPEDAWIAYNQLRIGDYEAKKAFALKEAAWNLALNRDVGKYLDKLTDGIPHEALRDDERGKFISYLGTIPAGWSVRILGKYLFDWRNTQSPNASTGSNCFTLAAEALDRMGLPNAPRQKLGMQGEPVGPDVFAWQKWWYANQGRFDELVGEVNYDLPSSDPKISRPPRITIVRCSESLGSLLDPQIFEVTVCDSRVNFENAPLNAIAPTTSGNWPGNAPRTPPFVHRIPPPMLRGISQPQNVVITVERDRKDGYQPHRFTIVSQTAVIGKAQASIYLQLTIPFPDSVRIRRIQEAAAPANKDAYLKSPEDRVSYLEELVESEPGTYRVTVTFDSPDGPLSAAPCVFTIKDEGNSYQKYLDEIRPID